MSSNQPPSSGPVRVEPTCEGRVARITLAAGKGNVLTREVIAVLRDVFVELGRDRDIRAAVVAAEGKHFSFGASVPEHVPGEVERMLPELAELFRDMARAAVPLAAAVRGACLGGGLELVLAAHHIVVAEEAELGLPEVTLGVFPPVAAAVLPYRVPQPVADRLVTGGEQIGGREAVDIGLADAVCPADEVERVAEAWAQRYAPMSSTAVRFATRASRWAFDEALEHRLAALTDLYLDELMSTEDAREGISAFLEKRQPAWVNR